ncbi:helix-turn-helix domain-containing protein, partial [Acidovorax sp.]
LDLPLWSGLRLQALAQWSAHTHRSSATSTVSPFSPTGAAPLVSAPPPVAAPLREAETALIRQAVLDARGNVAEAARALGISRATVYRKLGTPKGP